MHLGASRGSPSRGSASGGRLDRPPRSGCGGVMPSGSTVGEKYG